MVEAVTLRVQSDQESIGGVDFTRPPSQPFLAVSSTGQLFCFASFVVRVLMRPDIGPDVMVQIILTFRSDDSLNRRL